MENQKLDAQYWIDELNLIPHEEGGYYKEIYKSKESTNQLPERFKGGTRSYGTTIYFLLPGNSFSAFHILKADEVWTYLYGKPVVVYMINSKTGNLTTVHLGPHEKDRFSGIVPKECYFAARSKDPGPEDYSLVSNTVSPGFEYDDFQLISCSDLTEKFPQHKDLIKQLTRY